MSHKIPSQFDLAKQAMKEVGISRFNIRQHFSARFCSYFFVVSFCAIFALAIILVDCVAGSYPWDIYHISLGIVLIHFLTLASGIVLVSYGRWLNKYNEFVAKYSNVLEYKI